MIRDEEAAENFSPEGRLRGGCWRGRPLAIGREGRRKRRASGRREWSGRAELRLGGRRLCRGLERALLRWRLIRRRRSVLVVRQTRARRRRHAVRGRELRKRLAIPTRRRSSELRWRCAESSRRSLRRSAVSSRRSLLRRSAVGRSLRSGNRSESSRRGRWWCAESSRCGWRRAKSRGGSRRRTKSAGRRRWCTEPTTGSGNIREEVSARVAELVAGLARCAALRARDHFRGSLLLGGRGTAAPGGAYIRLPRAKGPRDRARDRQPTNSGPRSLGPLVPWSLPLPWSLPQPALPE